ncbi:MAG: helicase C-terminal domain-containing protein [Opitutales bacterium]
MHVSFDTRTVSLPIRELAAFATVPTSAGGSRSGHGGLWRAQAGSAWHEALRLRTAEEHPAARFEVPIAGKWVFENWLIELQGRADQIVADGNGETIREIKTVTASLPTHEEALRERYPAYFIQLAAYCALYPLTEGDKSRPPRGELVFVELGSGLIQVVSLDPAAQRAFEDQIKRLCHFLQRRRAHLQKLRSFQVHSPFSSFRPGQEKIREELQKAGDEARILLFEAPTGFGKTAFLLEYALKRLKNGSVTRILYLTGKSTGQIQVLSQLRRMLAGESPVSFLQVRNKKEHCINSQFHCFRETCDYLAQIETRCEEMAPAVWAARGNREGQLEPIREFGRQHRLCPYEITRSLLPETDIWVADYNYVFSPDNRSFFFSQPGFDPAQTLLLIDEAHNLPTRAADTHSVRLTVEDGRILLTEFTFCTLSPALLHAWENWLDFLAEIPAGDQLDPFVEADLHDVVNDVARRILTTSLNYAELSAAAAERLSDLLSLKAFLENDDIEKLLWSPAQGTLQATCLYTPVSLGKILNAFHGVIMASATFGPHANFLSSCGVDQGITVQASAPWREGAYRVAVDLRVDTRFKSRRRHLALTAETISSVSSRARGPIAVFFPSYRYATDVAASLADSHPELRMALQDRSLDSGAQTAFLEESLLLSDVLFLILGSRYTESIDLLGGRIEYAILVGPALPEVNPVQKARMESSTYPDRETAFRFVYQAPGMRKVDQAIGRLVREPGQTANILLHCQRFADPSYHNLLTPDHRPTHFIADSVELEAWLG